MATNRGTISFDVIVYAIIAVVILVVVLLFIFGPLGRGFGAAGKATQTQEAELAAAQNTCTQLCLQAGSLSNPDFWPRSRYCQKTFAIDLNADGKIEGDSEIKIRCGQEPILKDCRVTIVRTTRTQDDCEWA